MAIFTVNKSEISKEVKDEVACICEAVIDSDQYLGFVPKSGCLVAVGALLAEKGVSYQLDFEKGTIH